MDYKIKIFSLILILFFKNIFADVIYEKDEVIITSYELQLFKDLYFNQFNETVEDFIAIKKIVIQKKVISSLNKKNSQFLSEIDKNLDINLSNEYYNNPFIKDFLRISVIKNNFISQYFINNFSIEDIKLVLNDKEELKFSISSNQCLTIDKYLNLNKNESFHESLFENIKNKTNNYRVLINELEYSVCIIEKEFRYLERQLIKYFEKSTEKEFNELIYGLINWKKNMFLLEMLTQ